MRAADTALTAEDCGYLVMSFEWVILFKKCFSQRKPKATQHADRTARSRMMQAQYVMSDQARILSPWVFVERSVPLSIHDIL